MWKARICLGYISTASALPPWMGTQNLPIPWMLGLAMWFVLVSGVWAEPHTINCVCVCVCELCLQASGSFWPPPGEEHELSSYLPSACTTKWALWSRPTVGNQFQLTCRPTNAYLVSFALSNWVPFHAALLQPKLISLEGTDGEKLLFPKCQDQASRHCSMGNFKRETISTWSHIFF